MEEQRQRQEEDQRRALAESDTGASTSGGAPAGLLTTAEPFVEPSSEEAMLQRALALSTETAVKRSRVRNHIFIIFSIFIYELSKNKS